MVRECAKIATAKNAKIDVSRCRRDPFQAGQMAGALHESTGTPCFFPTEKIMHDPLDSGSDLDLCDPPGTEIFKKAPAVDELDEDISDGEETGDESETEVTTIPSTHPNEKTLMRTLGNAAGDWTLIPWIGGFIMFSANLQQFNAHCEREGHGGPRVCKCDKKIKSVRAIARQLFWLEAGDKSWTNGKKEHQEFKQFVGQSDFQDLRQGVRYRALHEAKKMKPFGAHWN